MAQMSKTPTNDPELLEAARRGAEMLSAEAEADERGAGDCIVEDQHGNVRPQPYVSIMDVKTDGQGDNRSNTLDQR
jgi:hypothetical protein